MENDKRYQVIIEPAANDRMFEHFEFLAQVNLPAANRLLKELVKTIRSLETSPHRNPPYNRPYLPIGKYRYMTFDARYRIIYQIDGDFVFIDDIQD